MKYETASPRWFGRHDHKSLGYRVPLGSVIMFFGIYTLVLHYIDPISVVNVQLRSSQVDHHRTLAPALAMNGPKDSAKKSAQSTNLQTEAPTKEKDTMLETTNVHINPSLPFNSRITEPNRDTNAEGIAVLSCNISEPRLSYCEIKGHVKIQGNQATILVRATNSSTAKQTSSLYPYVRQENAATMNRVTKWYVSTTPELPVCSRKVNIPAILFSIGGYSGNNFHDFSDFIVPLYLTSMKFNGEVQFLLTDYKSWWVKKFHLVLSRLSNYDVINIDIDQEAKCYEHLIIGLDFHKEFGIDPSKSYNDALTMIDFKKFLRNTYTLKRDNAIKLRDQRGFRPRLMVISRKKSRSFTNEDEIVKRATRLGYSVTVAEPSLSTNLSNFALEVNSCDVLMGVHGAGLTNMAFLPENAVIIQIIPFGMIKGLAKTYFEEPAKNMNIKYLEYEAGVQESTLIQKFPVSHAIFRDPVAVHRQGWDAVKSTYLDKQNITLNMQRFRVILMKANKFLSR